MSKALFNLEGELTEAGFVDATPHAARAAGEVWLDAEGAEQDTKVRVVIAYDDMQVEVHEFDRTGSLIGSVRFTNPNERRSAMVLAHAIAYLPTA